MNFNSNTFNKLYIGVVEDNSDPKKIGRVKVRVMDFFDKIPVQDIPWAHPYKDVNGNMFNIPDVGKIVTVKFDNDINTPEYIYANHYNINLENKLKSLSNEDYLSFKSSIFDHSTQIWRSKSKGLVIDHEYSNINIDDSGNINQNLRDNNSKLNVGSPDSSQSAVLGTTFFDWLDRFMQKQLSGPFLGNMGAPVIADPETIDLIIEYQTNRAKYLSKHVWIVDNDEVKEQEREYLNQTGDDFKSTTSQNNFVRKSPSSYTPQSRGETGRAEILNPNVPKDIQSDTSIEQVETVNVKNYPNGKVPTDKMIKNKWLSKDLGGDASYLITEASDALDGLMDLYSKSTFVGKQTIIFTDGYRSIQRQEALYNKYGQGRAATPGKSNHGWGIAIDMYWGVPTKMYKNDEDRPSGFKHPVYMWLLKNAPQFGWVNPIKLRDDSSTDEWWHWEWYGKKDPMKIASNRYNGDFNQTDIQNIKRNGGTYT